MQEEIAQLEVTGESGAGLVKITINGAHNCRRIDIDPSLMEDDKEMLEDLIAAALTMQCVVQKNYKKKNGISYHWNAITTRNEVSVLIEHLSSPACGGRCHKATEEGSLSLQ